MVLVAPRSAKIVEARGARFTLLFGYVFVPARLPDDAAALEGGHPVLEGRARLRAGRDRRRASPARPASHSLTGSVPVKRVGMASGTADLQRDLGGAIMQSIFGALLTAGYAAAAGAAIAASGEATSRRKRPERADEVVLQRRRHRRSGTRRHANRSSPRRRRRSCTATSGPTPPASSRCSLGAVLVSSVSRRPTRGAAARLLPRRGRCRALGRARRAPARRSCPRLVVAGSGAGSQLSRRSAPGWTRRTHAPSVLDDDRAATLA